MFGELAKKGNGPKSALMGKFTPGKMGEKTDLGR